MSPVHGFIICRDNLLGSRMCIHPVIRFYAILTGSLRVPNLAGCREAGAGLVELFIPKANREVVQRALNRGNALMVTAVEIGFAFAADRPVSATCKAILSAANLWRSIGRSTLTSLLLTTGCHQERSETWSEGHPVQSMRYDSSGN